MFHKFLNNKESELSFAYLLAKEGYFVVNMDMRGHGRRIDSYDNTQEYDLNMLIEDIKGTANDAVRISKNREFLKRHKIEGSRVMVGGVSVGATVALHCMLEMDHISAVACLIGTYDMSYIIRYKKLDDFLFFFKRKTTVNYENLLIKNEKEELFSRLTKDKLIPVCFLNGGLDFTVPPAFREEFHKRFMHVYESCGKRNMVMVKDYAKAGHDLTYPMKRDVINWLKKWEGVNDESI